ncbi:MAG: nucleotidyltransferase domain-containing protein [Sulfobacillus sp.]
MSTDRLKVPETTPVRLLLGDYHRRLLALLLLRPEEDFHLREIERLTGVPAGSARRELQRFGAAGLTESHRVGNQVRYKADRHCVVYEELASMLRKTTGMADVLRGALALMADRIEMAFLFGSTAQGKEGPYSDIDVMVIGTVSFEEVAKAVYGVQEKLGREVNPVILSPHEFASKLDAKDPFISRVMAESKIMLWESLREPGKSP